MRIFGLALIAILLLLPVVWLPGHGAGKDAGALFSQYLGLAALIAMATGQFIATRWPGVELVFGPLDQSYRIHKWLGIFAMVAILVHDTVDAEMRGLGQETTLVDIAETAGEVSLYGLLILVVITIMTFIPYHFWKWTHRVIGIFFVLGAFHYLFMLKPFNNTDPLGLYMAAICIIGTFAWIYTTAPRGIRPSKPYEISSITQEGQALAVEMQAQSGSVRHHAGQFAFFSFSGAGLNEPHPFTISSAPREDGSLRVTIAPLGDLTSRIMRSLEQGQAVRVEGPYGRFGRGASKPQLWIAAGIGVTPFLAMAEALSDDKEPVTMIYSVRNRADAAHLSNLEEIAGKLSNFKLVVWESQQNGRLSAEQVSEIMGNSFAGMRVSFCGPAALRRSLAKGLAGRGVASRNYHFEEFEIRTGLGLRSLAAWLWQRRERLRQANS